MVTNSDAKSRRINTLPAWGEGLEDLAIVSKWLNAASNAESGTESYSRVTKLIKEIREVEARWGWVAPTAPKAVRDVWAKLSRKHGWINRMLSRYSFFSQLQWMLLGKHWVLRLTSLPVEGEFVFKGQLHHEKKAKGLVAEAIHGHYRVGEADAVYRILNLAAASEIGRIRECETCSTWFYAQRSHQRFCSQRCQLKGYSATPKFKSYRKQYMRRFRSTRPNMLRKRN
jgi:hypothetical protein